jgi:hypothetical protein
VSKPAKLAARLAAAPAVDGPPPGSALARAPELLGAVARALNDCEQAGLLVQVAHGAVITDAGYVLRIVLPHEPGFAGDLWQVRTRQLTEFPADGGDDDDLDG